MLLLVCSASARPVTLCDAHPDRAGSQGACSRGDLVAHLHEASPSKVILSTQVFELECDALFLGDARSGRRPKARLAVKGAFSFSNCNRTCVLTEESLPVDILLTAHNRGIKESIPYGLEHMNCPGFANCTFKERNLHDYHKTPDAIRSPNDAISFVGQHIRKESGALCLDVGGRLTLQTTPF